MTTPLPVFTVGHSNRSLEELIALLQEVRVDQLVDVRSIPRSRSNPQFNADTISIGLAERQISYSVNERLGGRRNRQHRVSPETNAFWKNQSFHNYADYAQSSEFDVGMQTLLEMSSDRRTAIMCSEAVWWRCHRRFIADNLIIAGRSVMHIMGPGRADAAKLTPGSLLHEGRLIYPAGE